MIWINAAALETLSIFDNPKARILESLNHYRTTQRKLTADPDGVAAKQAPADVFIHAMGFLRVTTGPVMQESLYRTCSGYYDLKSRLGLSDCIETLRWTRSCQ